MAGTRKAAQARPEQLYKDQLDYVAYGSAEHRAILGIDKLDPNNPEDAKRIADLEKALESYPTTMNEKDAERKAPVEKRQPATRSDPGDDIIDGWKKRAPRR